MIGVKFLTLNFDQSSELDSGCYEIVRFFDGLDGNADIINWFPF